MTKVSFDDLPPAAQARLLRDYPELDSLMLKGDEEDEEYLDDEEDEESPGPNRLWVASRWLARQVARVVFLNAAIALWITGWLVGCVVGATLRLLGRGLMAAAPKLWRLAIPSPNRYLTSCPTCGTLLQERGDHAE